MIMFKAIKEFFTGKKAEAPVAEAPYKVEAEAKVEAVNAQPVEVAPAEKPAKKTGAKKPATKKTGGKPKAKKPAGIKAPK